MRAALDGLAFLLSVTVIIVSGHAVFSTYFDAGAEAAAGPHPSAEHVLKCVLIDAGPLTVRKRLVNETQDYSLSIGMPGDGHYQLKVTKKVVK